jgi:hypothetical protein
MSQEIRELALQATRGGAEGFFDLLDEYVLCDNRGYRRPDAEDVVFGREAVIQQYVRWWGAFEEYSVSAKEVTSSGRTAVVLIEERGQGKGSTVPLIAEHSQVWTFRRDRIIHIELFRDHAEALEAVGLSE